MSDEPFRVRMRTARDHKKAFVHYDELRRTGRVKCATIIAELHDGSFTVLGNQLTPDQMGRHLFIAAQGLEKVEGRRDEPRLHPQKVEVPDVGFEHSGGMPLMTTATRNPDGTLEAALGTTWLLCGECGHPRWMATIDEITNAYRRLICASCGNELSATGTQPSTGSGRRRG
jgi:hypothetical protein